MVPRAEEAGLLGDLLAALRPTQAPAAGERAGVPVDWPRWAFVQDHRNVGAQVGLDPHDLRRAQEQLLAVEMGLERDTVFLDFPQLRQAEDLKPAAVGQDG